MFLPKFFPDGVSVRKHTEAVRSVTGKRVGKGSTIHWRDAGGRCRNVQEALLVHDSDLMSARRKGKKQNC